MCRSTPPTRTPSQVNYAHTVASFKAHFHNNNPYTLSMEVRETAKHLYVKGKDFYSVSTLFSDDVKRSFVPYKRFFDPVGGKRCFADEHYGYYTFFDSSTLSAVFLKTPSSNAADHFTH